MNRRTNVKAMLAGIVAFFFPRNSKAVEYVENDVQLALSEADFLSGVGGYVIGHDSDDIVLIEYQIKELNLSADHEAQFRQHNRASEGSHCIFETHWTREGLDLDKINKFGVAWIDKKIIYYTFEDLGLLWRTPKEALIYSVSQEMESLEKINKWI